MEDIDERQTDEKRKFHSKYQVVTPEKRRRYRAVRGVRGLGGVSRAPLLRI